MATITNERVTCVDCMEVQAAKTDSGSMRGYAQGSKEIHSRMENCASRTNKEDIQDKQLDSPKINKGDPQGVL